MDFIKQINCNKMYCGRENRREVTKAMFEITAVSSKYPSLKTLFKWQFWDLNPIIRSKRRLATNWARKHSRVLLYFWLVCSSVGRRDTVSSNHLLHIQIKLRNRQYIKRKQFIWRKLKKKHSDYLEIWIRINLCFVKCWNFLQYIKKNKIKRLKRIWYMSGI